MLYRKLREENEQLKAEIKEIKMALKYNNINMPIKKGGSRELESKTAF